MVAAELRSQTCARLSDEELLGRLRRKAEEGVFTRQTLRTYEEGLRRTQLQVAGRTTKTGTRGKGGKTGTQVLQQGQQEQPGLPGLCGLMLSPDETVEALRANTQWGPSTRVACMSAMMSLMKHAGLREDERAGGRFSVAWLRWRALKAVEDAAVAELRATQKKEGAGRDAELWGRVMETSDRLEREAAGLRARLRRGVSGAEASALRRQLAEADERALLSSFYRDLEPRRQADYHRVRIVRQEGERAEAERGPAYVDATAGALRRGGGRPRLVVREYKTRKTYGDFEVALPERTWRLLKRSLESRPRSWVFCRPTGEPYRDANAFTKWHNGLLRQWYGQGVTLRALRHARATQLHNDPRKTAEERARIAYEMGHSVEVSAGVYASGEAPKLREDGTFEIMATGRSGEPERYECRPVGRGATVAARKRR